MRVQIPSYRTEWRGGDRWGDVIATGKTTATVRLDHSRRFINVILADCTIVDVGRPSVAPLEQDSEIRLEDPFQDVEDPKP